MNLAIKKAIEEDGEKINKLIRQSKAYWGYDDIFMDKFMALFGMTPEHIKNTHTFLFNKDESMIGMYSFFKNEEGRVELEKFFLHPDYVGKGLGRQLWIACCNTAKELGVTEFILWSDPSAENFYLKMGCEKVAEEESPVMPNRYVPIMKYTI
jgi:N-acetylglutamate synthase-like GNAT family acetyltransferase